MALSGEIMKYVGNELIPKGAEKGLSKIAGKATTSALSSLLPTMARNVGTELVPQAETSALGSLLPKAETSSSAPDVMTLFRGLTQKYDPNYPTAKLDTSGYESWTDNLDLARQYGDNVYSIQVPKSDIKTSYLDENPNSLTYGDRNPIYSIDKKAGLNGVSGNEYLLEVGSPYQKGLTYNEVPKSEVMSAGGDSNELGQALDLAVQNSGVDKSVANRAINYLNPKNVEGMLADQGGRPATLFHSTPNKFTKFDDSRLGENTDYSNTGFGHFVTTDKDFSSRFKDINNEGIPGRTMELRAKVKNPITHPYVAGSKYSGDQLDKIVENYYKAIGAEDSLDMLREYAAEDGQSLYDTYMDMTLGEDPFESAADERLALMNKGYDGIEIVEGPKSGLVEGSNDNTPVSSLAVFEGKNLSNINRIPVNKVNTAGVNIDINRGAEDAQRLIDADGSLVRLQNSPARGMLGAEQIDAYKRALSGENLSDEFLKNDKFARVLDEEVSKRPLLITPEQEANPSLIDPKMLSEFENTAKQFISQNLEGTERGRKAVIVLGRPSSGKSSGAVNLYTNKKGGGFFELDNDEIKKLLPGYDDGMGANAVHNASSLISKKMVLPELADNGYNIVLPIVGKKESSVMSYVDELANRGYEIAMINTNLPVDKCRTRNRTRAYETGRNVADAYLVSVGEKPDLVYNSIKEKIKNGTERRIGSYAEVSTDVPFGEKAILVENSGGELLARLGD